MLMERPTVLNTCLSICLDGDVFETYSASILHTGPHDARRKAASVLLAQMWLAPIYENVACRMARAKNQLHSLLYEAKLYVSKLQCC